MIQNDSIGLILTDSISMPRKEAVYKETWPFLLKQKFRSIYWHEYQKRGITTDSLRLEINDSLHFVQPSIILIQLGVVDCAPRLFTQTQKKIISNLPQKINQVIVRFTKKIIKRKETRVYVSPDCFSANLKYYCEEVDESKFVEHLIFIEIAPVSSSLASKNLEFKSNIDKYNEILMNTVCKYKKSKVISLSGNKMMDNYYTEDGYHFNAEGQKNLFEIVNRSLQDLMGDMK